MSASAMVIQRHRQKTIKAAKEGRYGSAGARKGEEVSRSTLTSQGRQFVNSTPDALWQTRSHLSPDRIETRPHDFSILSHAAKKICTAQLPRGAVPAFLAVSGLFDADWRLTVACRNGHIYTIKARYSCVSATMESRRCPRFVAERETKIEARKGICNQPPVAVSGQVSAESGGNAWQSLPHLVLRSQPLLLVGGPCSVGLRL